MGELLVIGWATLWALAAVRRMARQDLRAVFPVLVVSYAFLVAPLMADHVFGSPALESFPGMRTASQDPQVRQTYLLYIAWIFPALWLFGAWRGRPVKQGEDQLITLPEGLGLVVGAMALAPLLAALMSPVPDVYLQYTNVLSGTQPEEVKSHHALVSIVGRLAQISCAALLLGAPRLTLPLWALTLLSLGSTAWLLGKRFDIALSLVLILFVLWQRRYLRGPRLAVAAALMAMAMAQFSMSYQGSYRSENEVATGYEGARIDYGRDLQVRMSIYALQNPDNMQIVQYPGQTLRLYAGAWVPRAVWPAKPWPYSQYFTSALFDRSPRLWGWGMTTSWYDEWLSNLGRWGFVLAPAVLGLLCRFMDRGRTPFSRMMGLLICVMLITLEVTAFYALVALWVVLRLVERPKTEGEQGAARGRAQGSPSLSAGRGVSPALRRP